MINSAVGCYNECQCHSFLSVGKNLQVRTYLRKLQGDIFCYRVPLQLSRCTDAKRPTHFKNIMF